MQSRSANCRHFCQLFAHVLAIGLPETILNLVKDAGAFIKCTCENEKGYAEEIDQRIGGKPGRRDHLAAIGQRR